jgi:hypothetical protein
MQPSDTAGTLKTRTMGEGGRSGWLYFGFGEKLNSGLFIMSNLQLLLIIWVNACKFNSLLMPSKDHTPPLFYSASFDK